MRNGKTIALWVVAVLTALSGLYHLLSAPIGGILYILAAALMVPVPALQERIHEYKIKGAVQIALVVVLLGIGTAFMPTSQEPDQIGTQDTQEAIPQETSETQGPEAEEDVDDGPYILDLSDLSEMDVGRVIDTRDMKLLFGDLQSVIYGGDDLVVVKAKIQPSFSNATTISQNYHNVERLIRENGFDACHELQYWAVADMTSGEEGKVISFTLDRDLIEAVAEQRVVATQLGEWVKDLWILPSLQG